MLAKYALFFGLLIQLHGTELSNQIIKYIPIETQPTARASTAFPLRTGRINFGLEYMRQAESFSICPRIIFTSKCEAAEDNYNLQLYFCLEHYGVTLNDAVSNLQDEEGVLVVESKYRALWFAVNDTVGTIEFGSEHNATPIFVFNFTGHFHRSYFTHFGLAGSGRWILESDTPYFLAHTRDSERSAMFFTLNTERIDFAVQTSVNATWCPRIVLATKMESYHEKTNLSVIFCHTSISLQSGPNVTTLEHHDTLVNGSTHGYWLRINQLGGFLVFGEQGSRMSIAEYEYASQFDDYFVDHFALAGFGRWIVNYDTDTDIFYKYLATQITSSENSSTAIREEKL